VSTAAAATMLPHSKRCDTGMTGGQGNQSSVCRHNQSYSLPTGQEQDRLSLG